MEMKINLWNRNKEIELKKALPLVVAPNNVTLEVELHNLFNRIKAVDNYTINGQEYSMRLRLYNTFIGLFNRYSLNIEFENELNEQGYYEDLSDWLFDVSNEFIFRSYVLEEKLYAYYKKYSIDDLLSGDYVMRSKSYSESEDRKRSDNKSTTDTEEGSNKRSDITSYSRDNNIENNTETTEEYSNEVSGSNIKSGSESIENSNDKEMYNLPYVNGTATSPTNMTDMEKQSADGTTTYNDVTDTQSSTETSGKSTTSGNNVKDSLSSNNIESVDASHNISKDSTVDFTSNEDNNLISNEVLTITDTKALEKWIDYNEKIEDVITEFFNRYFRKYFQLVFD